MPLVKIAMPPGDAGEVDRPTEDAAAPTAVFEPAASSESPGPIAASAAGESAVTVESTAPVEATATVTTAVTPRSVVDAATPVETRPEGASVPEPPRSASTTTGPSRAQAPAVLRDWEGAEPASYVRTAAVPSESHARSAPGPDAAAPSPGDTGARAQDERPTLPPVLSPAAAFRAVPPAPATGPMAATSALPIPPGRLVPVQSSGEPARRRQQRELLPPALAAEPAPTGGTPTPATAGTRPGERPAAVGLVGRSIEPPAGPEEWSVLVGLVVAAASFILPWVPSQSVLVGGSIDDSYFARWGLGTFSDVVLFIFALAFLTVALLASQLPARLRFGVLPVAFGGACAGVGWLYLGMPLGFGLGVPILLAGAACMIVGGSLELRHGPESSSVT